MADSIKKLADLFAKFPTIGSRTAGRFVFYLLSLPKQNIDELLQAILDVRKNVKYCSFCFNLDENLGSLCSSYKTLPTMQEKMDEMMDLCKKIRAVDVADVARLVIERHFIRDTRGNLRKFSQQGFRCVGCNNKYRRPPLVGKCIKCNGKIIFTVSEGSVIKYLEPTINLANKYAATPYLKQSIMLLQRAIEDVFGKDKEKQTGLGSWIVN